MKVESATKIKKTTGWIEQLGSWGSENTEQKEVSWQIKGTFKSRTQILEMS